LGRQSGKQTTFAHVCFTSRIERLHSTSSSSVRLTEKTDSSQAPCMGSPEPALHPPACPFGTALAEGGSDGPASFAEVPMPGEAASATTMDASGPAMHCTQSRTIVTTSNCPFPAGRREVDEHLLCAQVPCLREASTHESPSALVAHGPAGGGTSARAAPSQHAWNVDTSTIASEISRPVFTVTRSTPSSAPVHSERA
jgi:hypothetical protein